MVLIWAALFAALAIGVSVGSYLVVVKPALDDVRRSKEEIDRSREQISREAELRTTEAILEGKSAAIKLREEAEQELREQRSLLARQEAKSAAREETLESQEERLNEHQSVLADREGALTSRENLFDAREDELTQELHRVANLSADEARTMLLARIENEFREIGGRRAREIEYDATANADALARRLIVDTMQRSVVDYVTEATLSVVQLPSEDMKGRLIGREGRNIRSFEQVTGVDLIIDETPEMVTISSFDPIRRETARLALVDLMADGRIHPGRIEELYEKATQEVQRMILDAGEQAMERAGVHGLPHKVVETMGRLRFRTSYAQNVLDHSVEVSRLAANLASELGLNVEIAKRGGFLHDIGKALGPEFEGPHALTGMKFLRSAEEKEPVLIAVGAHHHDIEPTTLEAKLVIIADSISAARPGARRESLEHYIKRLSDLEQLANSFPGVERSFAVQAGREIRLIVRPAEIDDLGAARLANEVVRKIENELEYPGEIRVTVIRETRSQGTAK